MVKYFIHNKTVKRKYLIKIRKRRDKNVSKKKEAWESENGV